MKLKQLRDSIKAKIKESPFKIEYDVPVLVDDGFGGYVPDPFGTTTPTKETVRISHEKIAVQTNQPSPAGLSTSLGLFLLTEYNSAIIENYILTDEDGKKYRVGPIDELKRFKGIYGKQAPLVIIEDVEDE